MSIASVVYSIANADRRVKRAIQITIDAIAAITAFFDDLSPRKLRFSLPKRLLAVMPLRIKFYDFGFLENRSVQSFFAVHLN